MRILREGPVKITLPTINAAWRRRASRQRLVVSDSECRGLALIVNATSMTWTYSFKPRGRDACGRRFGSRSVTIGNPSTHSPDDARTEANKLKGRVHAGDDPAAERRAKIAAAAGNRARITDKLVADYIETIPLRRKLRGSGTISPGHALEEISHIKAAVLTMQVGSKPVAEINAADLRALLRADPERPNATRHRWGALNRFFDWCQDEGLLSINPCSLVAKSRRPKTPASRTHYLSIEELAALWNACDDLLPVYRDLIRFLIAVPCRRGEAASMRWDHVDLAATVWSQPAHLTKNRDAHRLHLHPLALEILLQRHLASNAPTAGLVFPAPRSGKVIDTFTLIRSQLDNAAPTVKGWRIHDFRRSFATALGEAGISETVADAILNHRQSATRGGVLGVYQKAQRWPEQVYAMTVWGGALAKAIEDHLARSGSV